MTPTQEKMEELVRGRLIEIIGGELSACCFDDEEDIERALEVLTKFTMETGLTMVRATLLQGHDTWWDREEDEGIGG